MILVSIRFQEHRYQIGAFQEITRTFGILPKIVSLQKYLLHVDHVGPNHKSKGPKGWPAGRPHIESVQAETWWLRSYIGSQEHPMPESRWKLGGVGGMPHGWPPGHPSPPNQLNQVGGSFPRPLYKGPHGRTHTQHTILVVLHM
jgi:hypothetical protein